MMAVNNLLHNRQAKPRTALLLILRAVEAVEQMGKIRLRHTAPVILDRAEEGPVGLLHPNGDPPVRCRVLAGVFQQIQKRLGQPLFITADHRAAFDQQLLFRPQRAEPAPNMLDQLHQQRSRQRSKYPDH